MISRRSFIGALAALPVVGKLFATEPVGTLTVTNGEMGIDFPKTLDAGRLIWVQYDPNECQWVVTQVECEE